jgi:hypothetical protein
MTMSKTQLMGSTTVSIFMDEKLKGDGSVRHPALRSIGGTEQEQ